MAVSAARIQVLEGHDSSGDDRLRADSAVTQAKNCLYQGVRFRGRLACLVAAILCLSHSVAEGQDAPAVGLRVLQANLTLGSASEAQLGTAPLEVSSTTAGETSSLERSAAEVVAFILAISDVQSYDEQPAAGLRFSHESTELKLELPVMPKSPLTFFADFGVGATQLRSHDLGQLPVAGYYRGSEFFLSALGGLTVEFRPTDNCRAFFSARHFVYLNEADDLVLDGVPNADQLLNSRSWTFPISFGISLSFD